MDHSYFDDRATGFRQVLRARAASWLGGYSRPAARRAHERPHIPSQAPAPRDLDAAGTAPGSPRAAIEALALEGVTHRYGRKLAVDDVSVSLAAGEILCLCGPSGCGKSTLLRLAAGLEPMQEGVVRIGGQVVADARASVAPERRGVGLVFQDYALFPHLNVLDNVRFGLSGLPADEQRARALATLDQVGMADYAQVFPHALSGGQQQRVALARALAPSPAVLLLDEPFSGLDARLREQVRDETLHVLKRNGAATLLVTHDPEEAMFLGDRIALMNEGHLIQVGTPVELYTAPRNAFAATFFGEANRLRGVVHGQAVATPLGPVPTHLPEGEPVEVLVRPEALRLSVVDSRMVAMPVLAKVEAARLLGRTSLVHLAAPDGMGGTVHLHSRMPGQFLPGEGSHVAITMDTTQAFVFPGH